MDTAMNENTPECDRVEGITGRDNFIIAEALYWGIKYQTQTSVQDGGQNWSDIQDMKAILMAHFPSIAKSMAMTDVHCGRQPADLVDEKAQAFETRQ